MRSAPAQGAALAARLEQVQLPRGDVHGIAYAINAAGPLADTARRPRLRSCLSSSRSSASSASAAAQRRSSAWRARSSSITTWATARRVALARVELLADVAHPALLDHIRRRRGRSALSPRSRGAAVDQLAHLTIEAGHNGVHVAKLAAHQANGG